MNEWMNERMNEDLSRNVQYDNFLKIKIDQGDYD